MSELGELLRGLRGKKSLRKAAKDTGLSHSYIADIEKGFRRDTHTPLNPSPDTLKLIATAYNYPYKKLLEKAGYINPEDYFEDFPNAAEYNKKFPFINSGNYLKDLRTERELSKEKMADILEVQLSEYVALEKGSLFLEPKSRRLVSEHFGVSIESINEHIDQARDKRDKHPDSPKNRARERSSSSLERQNEEEHLFFFDEENITPEEMEELKKHLEFLRYKAAQENKNDS
ncbi:helix-turn-helix domain-containing protein [Salipaludibacillus sp. HK11]|uniref:helix-turn-helix domain-containing protein n=1 Tax=Salipaludibacillus sp. HK11 TaxID=3394320 RepID=UPI0039FD0B6D